MDLRHKFRTPLSHKYSSFVHKIAAFRPRSMDGADATTSVVPEQREYLFRASAWNSLEAGRKRVLGQPLRNPIGPSGGSKTPGQTGSQPNSKFTDRVAWLAKLSSSASPLSLLIPNLCAALPEEFAPSPIAAFVARSSDCCRHFSPLSGDIILSPRGSVL